MKRKLSGGSTVVQKSAAEFFSEHQQIAGFDNPAKSLFTTVREFVENSLDAAESANILPDIEVCITEYLEEEHNQLHQIRRNSSTASTVSNASSTTTASSANKKASKKKKADNNNSDSDDDDDEEETEDDDDFDGSSKKKKKPKKDSIATSKAKSSKLSADHEPPAVNKGQPQNITNSTANSNTRGEQKYYLISCRDNGCGLSGTRQVGESFGRVLSGSKHGIKQTRGKYGLGAKMALIWSKKSSGLPITVRTAPYLPDNYRDKDSYNNNITTTVLDIDIQKNEPKILSTKTERNHVDWHGLDISLTILGNWSNCRAKMLQYFQQLAVITPYANFSLQFTCVRDAKKNFEVHFSRRSDQMPQPPAETLPHPRGLNNITLQSLINSTKSQSLFKFLTKELYGISPATANKIIAELNCKKDIDTDELSSTMITALLQILRDERSIKDPSAASLSPAGEYNMRLGILKELQPRLIATFTDKAGCHEGHAFIVEAAVSIGGPQTREGLNVFRFANRIPLLFETGADVVTQVSAKRIHWNNYHIDPKKDNIGIFVSIVSTKIPFKGTSKEYIGDDVLEMNASVKRALQGCCQQLKVAIGIHLASKVQQERRKTLIKFIPDISRSLIAVIEKIDESNSNVANSSTRKRLLDALDNGQLTEGSIAEHLHRGVMKYEAECNGEEDASIANTTAEDGTKSSSKAASKGSSVTSSHSLSVPSSTAALKPVAFYLQPREQAMLVSQPSGLSRNENTCWLSILSTSAAASASTATAASVGDGEDSVSVRADAEAKADAKSNALSVSVPVMKIRVNLSDLLIIKTSHSPKPAYTSHILKVLRPSICL